ncbi:hypothetical protein A5742_14530 [Mycolicibacterium fortuitum]|uniref:Uncharacterized protein n=1 Tax=Mycolicibacterium fortuitum TaxID=1766 RepID=A0ABD6QD14_MYCFO|nr:hypothetical protein A5742_14530 [Mycolicibacterium fortuitum]
MASHALLRAAVREVLGVHEIRSREMPVVTWSVIFGHDNPNTGSTSFWTMVLRTPLDRSSLNAALLDFVMHAMTQLPPSDQLLKVQLYRLACKT